MCMQHMHVFRQQEGCVCILFIMPLLVYEFRRKLHCAVNKKQFLLSRVCLRCIHVGRMCLPLVCTYVDYQANCQVPTSMHNLAAPEPEDVGRWFCSAVGSSFNRFNQALSTHSCMCFAVYSLLGP